ncbi:trypsin-like peptidase domain-containing protein [Schlesneria paludicola]|uniref:trypsin-like peptidase domain-containing protein n=1 Tax=Schlesneria paludicola TaxID=360056 RepID=UPI00029A03E3|nr:trypsin-like peptidase domain-containing protein [Schlesneria paludicola]
MTKRLYICKLWSAMFLLAGTAVVSASERMTLEVKAVRRALPSVGNIHTEKAATPTNHVFNSEKARKINGMGTGIIIDDRGYMVTNYHVIADVDTIRVDIEDENRMKSSYIAKRVVFDREHDLAIIKIDGSPSKPFKVMPCGTSSDLMLSERVIAIGNAFGYDGTVTLGIISYLGRDVEANETVSYKNLIQTDAAINPGNSGGPLINMDGEVIGINVAIRANSQKIGFAIPIDDARKVIAKLMSIESLDRNSHGLVTKDVKSGSDRKLIVDGFQSNSPAALAGFRAGDIITKAGSVDVVDAVDLERALLHRRVGESVEITILRNDKLEKMSLGLAQYTGGRAQLSGDVQVTSRANNDESDRFWSQLGLRMVNLPASEQKSHLSNTKYRGGMRILEVKADSPAAANGIRKGDVLVGLDKWETISVDNITWIMNHLSGQTVSADSPHQVKFYVVRAQETQWGFLPLTQTAQQPVPRTASLGN